MRELQPSVAILFYLIATNFVKFDQPYLTNIYVSPSQIIQNGLHGVAVSTVNNGEIELVLGKILDIKLLFPISIQDRVYKVWIFFFLNLNLLYSSTESSMKIEII